MTAVHDAPPLSLPTAGWCDTIRPSMLYKFARFFGSNPDMTSFAGGAPDPNLYPKQALADAANEVIMNVPASLSYGRDLPQLKQHIIELMAMRGVSCAPEQIAVTAGGQHAMDLLTRLFLDPGGTVILEELVYTGIQQTVMPFQPKILTVPLDPEQGLDLDKLEEHLDGGARPAFLYTITSSHNPVGVSLSDERRRRLVALARQYRVPLIEDDAYGFLDYEREDRQSLRSLDPEWVVYLGTFSKILAPGMRLGWIVAPETLMPKLLTLKQLSSLSVGPLSQHIAARFISQYDFGQHIQTLRQAYHQRRDAMLAAMDRYFPPGVAWNKPDGGFFIWAELPGGIDAEELVYRSAEECQVGFIPGKAFVVDLEAAAGRYDGTARLSFSRYESSIIYEGMARLGQLLHNVVDEVKA